MSSHHSSRKRRHHHDDRDDREYRANEREQGGGRRYSRRDDLHDRRDHHRQRGRSSYRDEHDHRGRGQQSYSDVFENHGHAGSGRQYRDKQGDRGRRRRRHNDSGYDNSASLYNTGMTITVENERASRQQVVYDDLDIDGDDLQQQQQQQGVIGDLPKEKTESFDVSASAEARAGALEALSSFDAEAVQLRSQLSEERMLFGGMSESAEQVARLWAAKDRMDFLFDAQLGNLYYGVRERLFPQDHHGSSTFWNRAGDKLYQVMEEADVFPADEKAPLRFVDVCGGPGAFSQVLLSLNDPPQTRGWGITLRGSDMPHSDSWYKLLHVDDRFTAVFGPTNSGDVFVYENLDWLRMVVEKADVPIDYVVADGGFRVSTAEVNGEVVHVEHLQEIYSCRIVLSEVLAALLLLGEGGHVVCKLFDTLSTTTVSLVYAVALLFEKTLIVKPTRSRMGNSERYLVGRGLLPKGELFTRVLDILRTMHARCTDTETPELILPAQLYTADEHFAAGMLTANITLAEKQTQALNGVMDLVFHELASSGWMRSRRARQQLAEALRTLDRRIERVRIVTERQQRLRGMDAPAQQLREEEKEEEKEGSAEVMDTGGADAGDTEAAGAVSGEVAASASTSAGEAASTSSGGAKNAYVSASAMRLLRMNTVRESLQKLSDKLDAATASFSAAPSRARLPASARLSRFGVISIDAPALKNEEVEKEEGEIDALAEVELEEGEIQKSDEVQPEEGEL
jgi:cap1 methyltransferase